MSSTPYPYPFAERADVVPFVPATARSVLDVGCGLGGFGFALRRAGPHRTLWGVESDGEAAASAAEHYDRIVTGTFPDVLAGSSARFDCVVFNDVLEHMADPWAAMRRAVELLSPGGVIIASIPNVRFLRTVGDLVLRGRWTYTDAGVLDRSHLRFFTRDTAKELFTDSGLEVVHMKGINWIGHSRSPLSRIFPLVLRDFAYTGFLMVGRPATAGTTAEEQS